MLQADRIETDMALEMDNVLTGNVSDLGML
jgi:hypothetical protein